MQKKWVKKSSIALLSTSILFGQPVFMKATINDYVKSVNTLKSVEKIVNIQSVQDVKNGLITISGKKHKVIESLGALVNDSNRAALKGAKIDFTLNKKKKFLKSRILN